MKKALSCKSLSNIKSNISIKKQNNIKSKINNIEQQSYDKKDIKEIYQYRIKQKSNKNQGNKIKKDYKKEIFDKLMERQRIKTEITENNNHNIKVNNERDEKIQKNLLDKKNKSKNSRNSSKNNLTMNLNVSFVKIKTMGERQLSTSQFNKSKQSKQHQSKYQHAHNKINQFEKKMQEKQQKDNDNLKGLFNFYAMKNNINLHDLEQFYQLNMKVFMEFEKIIAYSNKTYEKIVKNISINQQTQQSKQIQSKLIEIQSLYKTVNVNKSREKTLRTQFSRDHHNNDDEIKGSESMQSSEVSSYKVNPQKNQNYRLKKLNQHLGRMVMVEQKNVKKECQTQITPKMYLSKPVSSNISRKISFANSLNNSLKSSKIE